jgi:hypothetical protein
MMKCWKCGIAGSPMWRNEKWEALCPKCCDAPEKEKLKLFMEFRETKENPNRKIEDQLAKIIDLLGAIKEMSRK